MPHPVCSISAVRFRRAVGWSRCAPVAGIVLCLALTSAAAQTPETEGFAIAARSDRSDRGYSDSSVVMHMILRSKAGKESTRALTLKTREEPDEDEGDKSLIVFDRPADVEGTALLSHAKILDPDDQWLYLPALKRVKRISSVNKSGPFVGSEFAFEDFTALELNKYTYRRLRTEAYEGATCDVIEQIPRYEFSGYTRQVSWIDREVFQVRKVEFYDRRGELLKTLRLADYREYKGGYWRAHALYMINHKTGKSTDLLYSDYTFHAGMTDRDFEKGVLDRIR